MKAIIRACLTVVIAVLLNGLSAAANAASFDCTKASARVERMICADAQLSELDGRMGKAYGELRSMLDDAERGEILTEQREFLGERATCEDTECIQILTTDRVTTLEERLAELSEPAEGAYETELADSSPAADAPKPVADEPKPEQAVPAPARAAPADTAPAPEAVPAERPATERAPSGPSQLPLIALVLVVAVVAVFFVLRRRGAAPSAMDSKPEPTTRVAQAAATVAAPKPFCTQCGTKLTSDVSFCTSCGAKRT